MKAKLPATFVVKGALWGRLFSPGDEEVYVTFSEGSLDNHGYFKIQDVSVELEVEQGKDPIAETVQALRDQITKARANFEQSVREHQAEIEKFLALSYSPSEA